MIVQLAIIAALLYAVRFIYAEMQRKHKNRKAP